MNTVDLIDDILKKRGMSRRQLALAAGIPPSSLQAAMARGKNMTIEMVQAIAATLNVSVSSLLGETNAHMMEGVQKTFITRLLDVLSTEESNIVEFYGHSQPYSDVVSGRAPLTIERAEKIADELGVTLDYLTGITDSPTFHVLSLPDYALQSEIDEADNDLIFAVHKICGMDEFTISKDNATGQLTQVWNPKKIDLIREFLEDNKPTIQKLLALSFPQLQPEEEANNGEHQED